MNTEILQKNLLHLKKLHPEVYEILKNPGNTRDYEITFSNSGVSTLSYIKPDKSKIYLLSKYDPLKEAKGLIASLNVDEYFNFIVLGLGLGYQVMELIKSIPEYSKIILIETDKNLARLAFETNDLSQILTYPGLSLVISGNFEEISTMLDKEKINFSLNGYKIIQQNSLSEVNPEISLGIRKEVTVYFQASEIELKTQSAKSQTFYKNISGNYQNMLASPGVRELKNALVDIPAIICSAGPSLDKNIQYLKAKRENFVLISAATALNSLQRCQVFPDFLVAIDPNELTTQFFNLEKDLEKTRLVYDPVIPSVIPTLFKGKRFIYDSPISLAHWVQNYTETKGSLGKVFSVAHAAYNLARLMGCSPIIFIGQDLSFNKKRLHSRNSYYYQRREDRINRLETMEILDGIKFKKYSKNILQKKDIFNNSLVTTVAMETYAQMFSDSIGNIQNTFNATEGGLGIKESKIYLLREILNHHCRVNIGAKKENALGSIFPGPFSESQISVPAKRQLLFFKEVFQSINKLECKYLNSAVISNKNKENLVLEMKSTIQNLLRNEEATLLLQGYDFLGFSLWNKRSNEILLRKKKDKSVDLLEEEFQRDREFLYALKNSLEFNINVFEDLAGTGGGA
ncbi:MAG: motility associated factor glycosyltransferase family protein [Nitrospinae bacterium]|nr:motility associated factor glycosyltransferase family protein [Nitrospinota bacterium]